MPFQFTCERCGKVFERDERKHRRFCSVACYRVPRPGIAREDGVIMVPLRSGGYALIDPEDAEIVLKHSWTAPQGYPIASLWKKPPIRMHRLIMGTPPSPELTVDHINRDPLDNRRSNLRWATHTQQVWNSRKPANASGFRGVVRAKNKWRAGINAHRQRKHLGVFPTPEEAARAYDAAAIEAYGEFAQLNFPEDYRP